MTICIRTGRFCEGGAFDGEDGWGIDCPTCDVTMCKFRKEINMQQYINRGCKGHYWTWFMTREEMTATDKDIKEYYLSERY